MNQHEITKKTPLLNHKGELINPGFARTMNYVYNREEARYFPFKLKEWDFYQFSKGDYVIQLTIGHLSYAASATATLINLKTGKKHSMGGLRWFFTPKLERHPEMDSYSEYKGKDFTMSFRVDGPERVLSFIGSNKQYQNFEVHLNVKNDLNNEKMVIATPFKRKKQFYLNYKENYYRAAGEVIIDDETFDFEGATGLLDWGRGIWPYRHEWFWGSVSSHIDGVPFGLNIGWGFGDLKNATENMYFYNKKAYKLGVLSVSMDKNDYIKPWKIHDPDGKIEFTFTPMFDNYTENKYVIIDTHCHQIYGHFTGSMDTPAGRKEFVDVLGFIEHAVNRW
ncbi:MAG: DUF2804 domain-containing protein [Bacilli bacterium]|jgi:hypothetical protein